MSVSIYVYPTSFRVKCDCRGALKEHPEHKVTSFINQFTEMQFNHRYRRWEVLYRYLHFNREEEMLYLPRYTLDDFLPTISHLGHQLINMPHTPVRKMTTKLKDKYKLRPDQEDLVEFLTNPDEGFKALSSHTGSGKAGKHSSKIKIPGGWTTMGEIQVGDIIVTPSGEAAPVIGKYPQGIKTLWYVEFEDGRYAECDKEHLWSVHIQGMPVNERTVVTTEKLQSLLTKAGRCYIDTVKPVLKSVEPDLDLPLHPYLLGVLIGDGNISHSVALSTDKWIIDKCRELLPDGHVLTERKVHSSYPEYYSLAGICFDVNNPPKRHIRLILKDMGLYGTLSYTKFIPSIYLNASYEQRLNLLQGLMDTDGYVSAIGRPGRYGKLSIAGSISYSTSSPKLRDNILQLVWSLGGKAKVQNKSPMYMYKGQKLAGRPAYIIHMRMPVPGDVLTVPRKRCRLPENGRNQYSSTHKLRVIKVVEQLLKKEECSCIMVDHPDHLYITDDYIVTHNTFCASAAMANIGVTTLVLTAGLVNQWWNELLDKTTLRKSDIYVIQGSDSLRKLIGATGYYPKVILASIRTMTMYVTANKLPYSEIMPYNEFQARFGIGLKIIDEVHENFFANTIIDVHSNIQHNIYLSASYERSNPVGERIFNKVFPKSKRYGDHLVSRYTTVNMLGYRLGVFLDETKLHTNQGYSHPRYEQWVLKNYNIRTTFFQMVVNITLDAYFLPNRKEKQKCLFVCTTMEMLNAMAAYITKHYPQLRVLCFHGDDDQSSITDRIDVIVSTIKKSGVGLDIKGLKVAANTISFKALPLAKQLMGRLRKIPGEETIFLDYYNYELNSHVRHKDARSSRYKDLAAKYYETTVN